MLFVNQAYAITGFDANLTRTCTGYFWKAAERCQVINAPKEIDHAWLHADNAGCSIERANDRIPSWRLAILALVSLMDR